MVSPKVCLQVGLVSTDQNGELDSVKFQNTATKKNESGPFCSTCSMLAAGKEILLCSGSSSCIKEEGGSTLKILTGSVEEKKEF